MSITLLYWLRCLPRSFPWYFIRYFYLDEYFLEHVFLLACNHVARGQVKERYERLDYLHLFPIGSFPWYFIRYFYLDEYFLEHVFLLACNHVARGQVKERYERLDYLHLFPCRDK